MKKITFIFCFVFLISVFLLTACNNQQNNDDFIPDNNQIEGDTTADDNQSSNSNDSNANKENGVLLSSKSLTIDGTTISAKLSYVNEAFNFANDITVASNATWVLSIDEYGMHNVVTKTAPLNEGSNIFYIHVTTSDQSVTTYTVNIYRNHLYSVVFNTNGGSTIDTQYVEEGNLATEPQIARQGYTFDGWDFDFNNPIKANVEISANWLANADTPYKVEYYLENLNKTDFDLVETINSKGVTDTAIEAEIKSFEHFRYISSKSIVSGNISGDETLVLKVYYERKSYTVRTSSDLSGSGTYPYGTEVTISYKKDAKLGYVYEIISDGKTLANTTRYTFTINESIDAQIKINIAPEMSNFDFSSDSSKCVIYRLKDSSIANLIVPNYVTEISAGAFENCSNLKSITLPFVGDKAIVPQGSGQNPFRIIFKSSVVPTTLREVTIMGGVIGSNAFDCCYYVTDIILGDGVTEIQNNAFTDFESLERITIGDGVTIIGDGAFSYCDQLKELTMGKNVIQIGDGAFAFCGKLMRIDIPSVLSSIGDAFYQCHSLTEINVDTNNTSYKSIDGNLYTKDGKILLQYAFGRTENVFVVPDGVEKISEQAFMTCSSVVTVVISNTVKEIENLAFAYCNNLSSVTIGTSVTIIADRAFDSCPKLIEVYNLSSLPITKGADTYGYVGKYAFDIYLNKNQESKIVTTGEGYVFYENGDVVYLIGYIGDNTELVISKQFNGKNYSIFNNAFYESKTITSVKIEGSVTSIGEAAFRGCANLKYVYIGGITETIGYWAFGVCENLETVIIDNCVKHLEESVFSNSKKITTLVIGNGITDIDDGAIGSFYNLEVVYYLGTSNDWFMVSIGRFNYALSSDNVYFYSAELPQSAGNYWRYVDGVPTIWW